METAEIIILISCISLLIALSILYAILRTREQTRKAWYDFEAYFKKKIELVSEAISEFAKYAAFEKDILNELAKAKKKAEQAKTWEEKEEANNILSFLLPSVFAAAEKHQDLRASQRFLKLREQIEGVEENIESVKRVLQRTAKAMKKMIHKNPFRHVPKFSKEETKEFFEDFIEEKRTKVKIKNK